MFLGPMLDIRIKLICVFRDKASLGAIKASYSLMFSSVCQLKNEKYLSDDCYPSNC